MDWKYWPSGCTRTCLVTSPKFEEGISIKAFYEVPFIRWIIKGGQMHKISKFYSLSVDLPYVKKARITYSHLADFTHKTLLIDFHQPMAIHSTLQGFNENILTIGNHFSPPPYWI
jgi:hypothetical protein